MESVVGRRLKKMMRWRRRGSGKYRRVEKDATRVVRLGGGGERGGGRQRVWRIKKAVGIKMVKPWRLWRRVKEAYVNMMVGVAARVGCLNQQGGADLFGSRRLPSSTKFTTNYSSLQEFEKRLVVEIYNSMLAAFPLHPISTHSFL